MKRWRLVAGAVFLLAVLSWGSFALVAGEELEEKSTDRVSQIFVEVAKIALIASAEEYEGEWGEEPIRLWLSISSIVQKDEDGEMWQKVLGYFESLDGKSRDWLEGRLEKNGKIYLSFKQEDYFRGVVLKNGSIEGFSKVGTELEYRTRPLLLVKKGETKKVVLSEGQGNWFRITDNLYYQGHLNVVYQTKDTLGFDLNIIQGARVGRISGIAEMKGNQAVFEDGRGFQLMFDFTSQEIQIKQKGNNIYAGAGAHFTGTYVRKNPDKSDYSSLVERKIFTEGEDQTLRQISGTYYDRFFQSAMLVFTDEEELDGFGAKVYRFGVTGLFTIVESIVMVNDKGEMWAATIENELIEVNGKVVDSKSRVRYFTNTDMTHVLPKTIVKWRERFKRIPVVLPEGDV